MGTNDFDAVSVVLSDDFVLEWPKSRERVRGAGDFGRLNQDYPGGPWKSTLNPIVAGDGEVVTDVTVSDGSRVARAISLELRQGSAV